MSQAYLQNMFVEESARNTLSFLKWESHSVRQRPNNRLPKCSHFDVKSNNKSLGNGIIETVKSCDLHQKGRILWF